MITYRKDVRPAPEEIAVLYACAPLRRPVGDLERLKKMYSGSNIVVTAFDGPKLVGILRGWTDGVFDGYICDLAVHPWHQKSGIGSKLLDATTEQYPGVSWILLASPLAEKYYAHVGWSAVTTGWQKMRPGVIPTYDDFKREFARLRIEGGLSAEE